MIGVFDSGIGGLTVVRALLETLPHHSIIYLGDTARTPYGSKSARTIIKYSLNNTRFLLKKGADIIVIACNTASSYAYDAVKARYDIPVFEVIGPGAALAVRLSRRKRIGVIGTRATVASGVYEQRIKQYQPETFVIAAACPLLVPLVEEGWLNKPETRMLVRKYLQPLKNRQIDTLVLGCTHYPVLRPTIQRKIGLRVKLVDSAEAIALQVKDHLRETGINREINNSKLSERCRIFVTDTADQSKKTADLILGHKISIEQADF
jgi:glutamate racemase